MTPRERDRITYDLESLRKAQNHERAVRNRMDAGSHPSTQAERMYVADTLAMLGDDIRKLEQRIKPSRPARIQVR